MGQDGSVAELWLNPSVSRDLRDELCDTFTPNRYNKAAYLLNLLTIQYTIIIIPTFKSHRNIVSYLLCGILSPFVNTYKISTYLSQNEQTQNFYSS